MNGWFPNQTKNARTGCQNMPGTQTGSEGEAKVRNAGPYQHPNPAHTLRKTTHTVQKPRITNSRVQRLWNLKIQAFRDSRNLESPNQTLDEGIKCFALPPPNQMSKQKLVQLHCHSGVPEAQNDSFKDSRNKIINLSGALRAPRSSNSNSQRLQTHKFEISETPHTRRDPNQILRDPTHPETPNQARSETLQTYTAHS